MTKSLAPELSIIIVNYNTRDLLKSCLRSVFKNKDKLKLEVIVVDNGSTDGSPEMVKKESPRVRLIENEENLGFAKAVNQGIKRAKGEYILLLNSDVIMKSGALREMLNFAERHPLAGIIGGKLVGPDGSIQASVYHFPTILRAVREFWFGQKDAYQKYAPQVDKPAIVDAVTGAAMLIPKKIIDEVGLLDERYFMYFEDLDYCRRVKKTGYRTYYLPQVEFVHYHGASGKEIPELTHQWLVQSSKLYNGLLKYYLLTLIIWLGQKWQKILGKR